jgi:hypothetical protein
MTARWKIGSRSAAAVILRGDLMMPALASVLTDEMNSRSASHPAAAIERKIEIAIESE